MSARYLLGLFDAIYLVAMAAWVGNALFFTFAAAPLILRNQGAEISGKLLRALLPRYHAWGAIAGAIALPSYVAVPLCYPEYRGPWVGVQSMVLLGCILLMLYAGNSLTPRLLAARDAGDDSQALFDQLRRRMIGITGGVAAAGMLLMALFVIRPAPRSTGITELSPVERGRFDVDLDRVIEDIETRYGFRVPGAAAGKPRPEGGSAVSPEMARELEFYYAEKRRRDLARRKGAAEGAKTP